MNLDQTQNIQNITEHSLHRDRNSQKTNSKKYNQMQTLLIGQLTDVKRKIVYASKRHYSLIHNKNGPGDKEKIYKCSYEGCNDAFTSQWYLIEHKEREGHVRRNEKRGRKKKENYH